MDIFGFKRRRRERNQRADECMKLAEAHHRLSLVSHEVYVTARRSRDAVFADAHDEARSTLGLPPMTRG